MAVVTGSSASVTSHPDFENASAGCTSKSPVTLDEGVVVLLVFLVVFGDCSGSMLTGTWPPLLNQLQATVLHSVNVADYEDDKSVSGIQAIWLRPVKVWGNFHGTGL